MRIILLLCLAASRRWQQSRRAGRSVNLISGPEFQRQTRNRRRCFQFVAVDAAAGGLRVFAVGAASSPSTLRREGSVSSPSALLRRRRHCGLPEACRSTASENSLTLFRQFMPWRLLSDLGQGNTMKSKPFSRVCLRRLCSAYFPGPALTQTPPRPRPARTLNCH